MKTINAATMNALVETFGSQVSSGDLYAYDKTVFAAAKAGALVKVKRGVFQLIAGDINDSNEVPAAMTDDELASEIESRFAALELLADSVVQDHCKSLIVSGAPGVGKSFEMDKKLNAAAENGKVGTLTTIKGSISAIGLFLTLWEHKEFNDVIVLDDIDSIFSDEEAMNLLKGALDTNSRRVISWIKDSSFLRDRDIPNTFEFKGRVVFLTNVDMQAVADKGGKMAPHMGALMSRAVFLDLGIHSPKAIMVRIRQVLRTTDMAKKLSLSTADVERILAWMDSNMARLRAISLRTVIQISGFMKTTNDWQLLAKTTLLRNR